MYSTYIFEVENRVFQIYLNTNSQYRKSLV